MIKYLFLYGTLIEPEPPEEITPLVKRLPRIGTASIPGRLYDLGDYPGAVVDASANTSIHGELVELPEDETVLDSLDKYEEFDPDNPKQSLFVRRKVNARLVNGENVDAWMYVYNKQPGDAPIIPGGTYSKSRVA
ncbi:MAG: hypothetical protein QOF62_1467 [Pyrinomonadaceae bacterium]|jgi:gamma-glutamylcyclotransferase (GGCT)/AIG2-like uncharacterized protein YtfP|nr:hypothetical protein [Pyrinomonadaceae bacterium]